MKKGKKIYGVGISTPDKKIYEVECSRTEWDSIFVEATDLQDAKRIANENISLGIGTSDLGFNSVSSDWTVESVEECKDEVA